MTIRRRIAVAIVVAAGAMGEHAAMAAPAEMTQLFEQGRALVKEGQYEQAIAKFLESLKVEPSVGALLNLGDCYERVGKPVSARRRFLEAAELAGEDDKVRSAEARARAAKLADAAPRLMVVRRGRSDAGEARVTVDGELVAPRTDRVELDPGPHEVVIAFPDAPPEKRIVILRMGQALELLVEPPPAKPLKTTPLVVPETPTPPAEEDAGSTRRWLGLGTGAIGTIALGVGATFGVIAIGKQSDLDAKCAGYPHCPEAQRAAVQPTYDDAQRSATISTIGIIGGSVLLATGIVLWLTAPEKKVAAAADSTFRMGLTF
jgi:hypothetical protein